MRFIRIVLLSALFPAVLAMMGCYPTVVPAGADYVYVCECYQDLISGYVLDTEEGESFRIAGAPFSIGLDDESIINDLAAHPSGRFLYVLSQNPNQISGFSIDPPSGALTPLAGSPFKTSITSLTSVISRSGGFLYVMNRGTSGISAFRIDPVTGIPAEIPGSPFPVKTEPANVILDDEGRFLFARNRSSDVIMAYAADPGTGRLKEIPGSPFPAGTGFSSLAIGPESRFLYEASPDEKQLRFFRIDADTGRLSEAQGSPVQTNVKNLDFMVKGWEPRAMVMGPSGDFLYMAVTPAALKNALVYPSEDWNNGRITAFAIDRVSGVPRLLDDAERGIGKDVNDFVLGPTGAFLFTSNHGSDSISIIPLDPADGHPGSIRGEPIACRSPCHIAVVKGGNPAEK